jgi:DNA-binding transcriptional regulator YiaG
MTNHRTRRHNTPFAGRLRRLRLSVAGAARLLRTPVGTIKNWKQGRSIPPRAALRLLAAWRLLHWRQR